jgi:cardiolipin synthase
MSLSSAVFKTNNYYPADEVQLVYSGNDYFDTLVQMIRSAEASIHFQTYIFDNDSTGQLIVKELIQAAQRGVKIHFLVDAFGSKELPDHVIRDLRNAGIRARLFAPFFSRNTINLGRRMHHKVVVTDHKTALVGGINISDKYRGTEHEAAWLDYAILIKGKVCEKASAICSAILNRRFPFLLNLAAGNASSRTPLVRFRQNDRLRGKRQISKGYIQAIKKAEKSIVFISSYFLPGQTILKVLKKAARRGVQVSIILSANSDILLFGKATSHLYVSLMKEGIHIYEWQNSILHGKIGMVDEKWITVGSFNLNYLSALSSIELNVEVIDDQLAAVLEKHVESIIQNGCRKIEYENYLKENTWKRKLINTSAYYLTRFFMKGLALFPRFLRWSKED